MRLRPCSRGSNHRNHDCDKSWFAVLPNFWEPNVVTIRWGLAPFPDCHVHICHLRTYQHISGCSRSPVRCVGFYRLACYGHILHAITSTLLRPPDATSTAGHVTAKLTSFGGLIYSWIAATCYPSCIRTCIPPEMHTPAGSANFYAPDISTSRPTHCFSQLSTPSSRFPSSLFQLMLTCSWVACMYSIYLPSCLQGSLIFGKLFHVSCSSPSPRVPHILSLFLSH